MHEEPFRGAAGAERFAHSVMERSRWARPARLPGTELFFLDTSLRIAPPARADRRVIRIEPHIHLRSRYDIRQNPRVRGHGHRTRLEHALVGAGSPLRQAPIRPLSRALLRHPLVAPSAERGNVEPVMDESRRIVQRWTTVAESSIRRLIRRIAERSERIDAVTTSGVAYQRTRATRNSHASPPTSSTLPAIRVAVPVRRIVRRVVPAVENPGPVPGRAIPPEIVPVPIRKHGADPPGELGVNVEKLTDQVVKSIDRRLVAHRERLGRI